MAPMIDVSSLFSPFRIAGLELKNRFVMSPMTRTRSPQGVPTAEVAAYYRRRAEGGTGLLITEGTLIDRRRSGNNPNIPNIHGEGLRGWRQVVDAVHDAGGRIWSQLWHVGALPDPRAPEDWHPEFESPSGLSAPGQNLGTAMSDADIADTIDSFARAAADAWRTGFDGIEIHGAHGYLLDQFFWSGTNRRKDSWGGASLSERSRFAAEVVRAVRAAIPDDMPLCIRISQYKIQDYECHLAPSEAELGAWLIPLAEAGVDIFHCSQREFTAPAFPGAESNLAGYVKRVTGKPTITVGSVGLEPAFFDADAKPGSLSLRELIARLERDEFDLVSVGRAVLSEPSFVRKLQERRFAEMRPFSRELISAALD
jgi:2,4-dienoyl-CoA reductase-like NADH-dependent reductase (Old Yellow Enzyme family)